MKENICPVCLSHSGEVVYENKNLTFCYTGESHPFSVTVCNECGFVFQDSAYCDDYDLKSSRNYLVFDKSANFSFPNRKKDNLIAVELIARHIPKKDIVNVLEIGSNRGDLLYLIKEKMTHANVLGIEPTYFENLALPTIQGFFSSKLFSNKFDVVVLQHVLEHIKNPKEFLEDVRKVMADDSILYIEVPDVETALCHKCEDFTLEHVSYFSQISLENCCTGFEKIESCVHTFLHSIFRPKDESVSIINKQSSDYMASLFVDFQNTKQQLIPELKKQVAIGNKVVFYGSSAYFRMLYRLLKNEIGDFDSFFYDDNNTSEQENCFGLSRINSIEDSCVVVVCSNNWRTQEAIKNKLLNLREKPSILIPWSEFIQ